MNDSKDDDPRDVHFSRVEKKRVRTLVRRRNFLRKVIAQEADDPQDYDKAEEAALTWGVEKLRQLTALAAETEDD